MKRNARLAVITILGLVLLALLTGVMYSLRYALGRLGYDVPPELFFVAFLAVLGGGYGYLASVVLREVRSGRNAEEHPSQQER